MPVEIWKGLLIPFVGTALGSACVFFMRGSLSARVQRSLTGFAAGVMVAASIWSLLIPAMEEAAEAGGSGNAAKWRKIILPLTSGPVISGMGMVAISSMMELTTSSLLWSGGSETVGVVIFNFTSAGMSNLASAYSSIILILILAVFMLYKLSVLLLTKGGKKYVDSNK